MARDKEKQKAWHKRRYQTVVKERRIKWLTENGPCAACGSCDELEVDHIDPKTKVDHKVWSWSEKRRISELAKCQVLCYDCHLKKTIKQFQTPIVHGTLNGYLHKKCRCSECTAVHAQHMRDWKEKTRYKWYVPKKRAGVG